MNEPKVWDLDYINFLLATPRVVSDTEAERVQPEEPRRAAHDAFTRLLHRLEPDTTALWREAEFLVDRTRGLLVIDDSTLDKPYSGTVTAGTVQLQPGVRQSTVMRLPVEKLLAGPLFGLGLPKIRNRCRIRMRSFLLSQAIFGLLATFSTRMRGPEQ